MTVLPGCADQPAPYLRIGATQWTGIEPIYLARTLGYYDDKRIHLVEYASSTQVIRDLNNNAIEGAAVTLDEAMLIKQYGQEIYIVLVADFSHGGDVIMAHPELETMHELKGHRIGSENTALGAYVLSRALEQADMTSDDVSIVMKERHEHIDAYVNGEVDAVVTFDPVRTQLLKEGAVEIFNSSRIPDEIVDVLVVRKDYFDNHMEVVTDLLIGWFRSVSYMENNRKEAHRIIAERTGMSPQEVLESFAGIRIPGAAENHDLVYSGRLKSTLIDNATVLKETMLKEKLLNSDVNIESCFIEDSSYFLKIVNGLAMESK